MENKEKKATKKYSYENQEIRERAERLIKNEIYVCQSSLIDKLLTDYDLRLKGFVLDDIINLYSNDEEEGVIEIYEWYAISEWLADMLEELQYPVLKNDYGQWMGRTTTGQSIILDSIIYKVLELQDRKINEL